MDPEEKKKKLTDLEYKVTQEKATEAPFSGELLNNKEEGMYVCKVCGQILFSSQAKFESGSGWPSFDKPENIEHINLVEDNDHGMIRTEVQCKNCGAHLGHVFSDGPKETTGKRFCINSSSLDFKKEN